MNILYSFRDKNISNPTSHFDIESGIGNSTMASLKNRQGYE